LTSRSLMNSGSCCAPAPGEGAADLPRPDLRRPGCENALVVAGRAGRHAGAGRPACRTARVEGGGQSKVTMTLSAAPGVAAMVSASRARGKGISSLMIIAYFSQCSMIGSVTSKISVG